MEVTIPYYAIWILGTFGGGFLGWLITLTLMAFRSREESRLSNAKDLEILNNIDRLERKLNDSNDSLNDRLDGLDTKIDKLMDFLVFRGGLTLPQSGNKPV